MDHNYAHCYRLRGVGTIDGLLERETIPEPQNAVFVFPAPVRVAFRMRELEVKLPVSLIARGDARLPVAHLSSEHFRAIGSLPLREGPRRSPVIAVFVRAGQIATFSGLSPIIYQVAIRDS
jgi:hypothetical protein